MTERLPANKQFSRARIRAVEERSDEEVGALQCEDCPVNAAHNEQQGDDICMEAASERVADEDDDDGDDGRDAEVKDNWDLEKAPAVGLAEADVDLPSGAGAAWEHGRPLRRLFPAALCGSGNLTFSSWCPG